MKINEVEALAGITKKNIRFYEAEGLLYPARNAENGYRDYCEEDVASLKRIKLMRKLGVPIEEIRQMQSNTHTVGDSMRRHLVTLEREKRNTEQSIAFCGELAGCDKPFAALDPEAILLRMEEMEQQGMAFRNKQREDVRAHYVAPVVITTLFVGFMLAVAFIVVWAYRVSPEDAPPVWFLVLLVLICIGAGAGAVAALLQRIREIGKGEMEDAKRY